MAAESKSGITWKKNLQVSASGATRNDYLKESQVQS